jgi:hypothetical protein
MMRETITFTDVHKLLGKLGFETLVNDRGNKVFRYPNTDVMIILPAYQPNEAVPLHHLLMIRHTLDSHGLMGTAAFDGLTEKVAS